MTAEPYLVEGEVVFFGDGKPLLQLVLPVAHDVLGQDQHAPLIGEMMRVGVQQGDSLDGLTKACTHGHHFLTKGYNKAC